MVKNINKILEEDELDLIANHEENKKVKAKSNKANKNKDLNNQKIQINNNGLINVEDKTNLEGNINEKEIERIILLSINQLCDYDIILNNILYIVTNKLNFNDLLDICKITPGIPLKPQLARPTTGINMILDRFESIPFSCEFKYDGFRGQIHHFNNTTKIFSRNLEDMTESYPDFIKYVEDNMKGKVSNFILDAEIVAFDPKDNKILPFHNLTTRSRKNVSIDDISVNICMFLFDLIFLNSTDLCNLTLEERRIILKDNFTESANIQYAKVINSEKFEDMETFMQESVAAGKF